MNQGNKPILIFTGREELEECALSKWKELSFSAVKDHGHFTVALSGGITPRGLYRKLSEQTHLPWNKTHIFFVDERFVPHDHDDSNYRMIKETLIDRIAIAAENIHPILTDTDGPDRSAMMYERELNSYFSPFARGIPRFDLILLGIGDDGHTGSLFPGTHSLSEHTRLVTAVSLPDPDKKDRVTITFPLINNAKNIIFMAAGENKAGIIKDIVENRGSLLPASRVHPKEGNLYFFLDASAGKLLTKKEV